MPPSPGDGAPVTPGSPADFGRLIADYRDWLDYIIVEDGRDVGRVYEDRHSRPELRWFWSITVYVNPMLGITTSGRAASIEEAKAQFLANWQKCRANSTPGPAPFI